MIASLLFLALGHLRSPSLLEYNKNLFLMGGIGDGDKLEKGLFHWNSTTETFARSRFRLSRPNHDMMCARFDRVVVEDKD